MDFWRTVLVLVRRWYITVPAFFMTLGLAGAAYSVVPVQYQSVSVLVLTTPLSGGTETAHTTAPNSLTNPLLNFDQSLALTASIVIQEMNSLETAQDLGVTPGGSVTYQVTNGSTNPELLESGPFLFVEGTALSAPEAQDITQRASAMAARTLADVQNAVDAPVSTHIGVQVVVPATAGQPLTGSPMRMAAAAGAFASLLSLAAVFGFESMATHRRRRREEAADVGEGKHAVAATGTERTARAEHVGALARSTSSGASAARWRARTPRWKGAWAPRDRLHRPDHVAAEE